MKKFTAFFSLLVLSLVPTWLVAAEFPEHLVGRVVVDVSSDGEAWYINPRSRMRVYLGRPEEALERLTARAFYVNYLNIARIAPDNGNAEDGDLEYVAEVAGNIIAPNDVIGAAWYVDPDEQVRRRLATPHDAWLIMQDAIPVTSVDLAGVPIEGLEDPRFESVSVAEVLDATTVSLCDGREVRLVSLEVPDNPDKQQAAKYRLMDLLLDRDIVMERDGKSEDDEGRLLRFLHADDVNMNVDLVQQGLAFDDIAFPHFRYAEQLIVARLDAMRHGNGFWAQE